MGCTYTAEMKKKKRLKGKNTATEPCLGKIQRSHVKNVIYSHLEHFLNSH